MWVHSRSCVKAKSAAPLWRCPRFCIHSRPINIPFGSIIQLCARADSTSTGSFWEPAPSFELERAEGRETRGTSRAMGIVSFLLSFFLRDAVPPRTILPYQPTDDLSPYTASTSSSSSSSSSSCRRRRRRPHRRRLLLLSPLRSSRFLLAAPLSRNATHAPIRQEIVPILSFAFSSPRHRPTDCIQIISRMPRVVPVHPRFVLVAVYRATEPKVIFTMEFPEFSILLSLRSLSLANALRKRNVI